MYIQYPFVYNTKESLYVQNIGGRTMRTEMVELTNLCMIKDGDKYLLQNRIKKDWQGYTFPGGHVEPG